MRSTHSSSLPVDTWYPAVFSRRSRRSYLKLPPSAEAIARLAAVCREFRPFPEARSELIREPGEDVFKGIIGAYGKIENAPLYLAFIGNMDSPRVQEAVGYTGEGVILEATALDLGTCWVGGFFRPESVARQLELAPQERVLAVSPVGMVPDSYTFKENIMSGFGRMHRRQPLHKLVEGTPREDWMRSSLEAARAAPSAVNRQPWRFRVSGGSITVNLDDHSDTYNIARRLDCGIAMLHLELGARYAGASVYWAFPSDSIARLST